MIVDSFQVRRRCCTIASIRNAGIRPAVTPSIQQISRRISGVCGEHCRRGSCATDMVRHDARAGAGSHPILCKQNFRRNSGRGANRPFGLAWVCTVVGRELTLAERRRRIAQMKQLSISVKIRDLPQDAGSIRQSCFDKLLVALPPRIRPIVSPAFRFTHFIAFSR